jgi:hypothetical protein
MVTERTIRGFLIAAGLVASLGAGAAGAEDAPSNQELLNKMKAMEQRIQMLEHQLEQRNATASPPASPSPAPTAAAPPSPVPAAAAAPAAMVQTAP